MEQSVRQRRFGSVARLTVDDAMPARIREILIENLEVDRRDVYTVDGPLGLERSDGPAQRRPPGSERPALAPDHPA